MEPTDPSSLLAGVLECGDDLTDRGELLSACGTEGLSNCPSSSYCTLVTYGQGSQATLLHPGLFLHRNKDVQRRWRHHPWWNILLIGIRQGLVGGR